MRSNAALGFLMVVKDAEITETDGETEPAVKRKRLFNLRSPILKRESHQYAVSNLLAMQAPDVSPEEN